MHHCLLPPHRAPAQELRILAERWRAQLEKRRTRKDAAVWRATELLLGQPVITVTALAKRLKK